MKQHYDILVLGGGAAGFFTAINAAAQNPSLKIAILERGKDVLTKVKISGGGRCNVTHAEFVPKELSQQYPRGEKELLGPFHSFMTGDTIAWFEQRGVALKIEEDGRMFPLSNSSQTIINCFISETRKYNISVIKNQPVKQIIKEVNNWKILSSSEIFESKDLVVATGSNPKVWKMLAGLGHSIIPPVPSLFTFNSKDERIANLPGVVKEVSLKVLDKDHKMLLQSEGPLLITHWGMSGPAILKLSAWGARILAQTNYNFTLEINWTLVFDEAGTLQKLLDLKEVNPRQTLHKYAQFDIPKRLWKSLLKTANIIDTISWADVTKKQLQQLAVLLTKSTFDIVGKSTFKEEFVTAGGVDLKEVNFKTFESKLHSNLYFAGEVLNIDAITGGFNFQNAWTSGFMVAKAITI